MNLEYELEEVKRQLMERAVEVYELRAEVRSLRKLESAAIQAAKYLQRKEAGQCANELAGNLSKALDSTTGEDD